jgi:hypothetical protein
MEGFTSACDLYTKFGLREVNLYGPIAHAQVRNYLIKTMGFGMAPMPSRSPKTSSTE